MTRRQFIAASALGTLDVLAKPIRSNIGGRKYPNAEPSIPSASLYVQDGLVAIWDGIENVGEGVHDSSAPTWVDLVAGIELSSDAQLSWGNDYLYVNSQCLTRSTEALAYLQQSFFNMPKEGIGAGYTIEVVVNIASTGSRNIFGE